MRKTLPAVRKFTVWSRKHRRHCGLMGAVLQKPMFTECCGDRGEEVPAPGEWRNTPGLSGLFPISHFAGHPQHGGPTRSRRWAWHFWGAPSWLSWPRSYHYLLLAAKVGAPTGLRGWSETTRLASDGAWIKNAGVFLRSTLTSALNSKKRILKQKAFLFWKKKKSSNS